ncbi:hypothetical protein ABT173_00375 [Streptomyces sp. NPDC001795]|uniref:hypothetical protein n=1 Tax=Streptomyces sp. NPDC001795 TaxID=3154525 RepID=UPI00331AE02C
MTDTVLSGQHPGKRQDPLDQAGGDSPGVHPGSRARWHFDAAASSLVRTAVVLLTVFLLLLIVRLAWLGDLGLHAATIERLRADLFHPGSPQVDADTDSPYYSPWTVLLGIVAKASGWNTFSILRLAALVTLTLLLTGIWHFTRTLSNRRLAPHLAVLCLLLLWGPPWLAWSGFLELGSLALVISYPSTFVVALSFHFWALLTKALRSSAPWRAFLGLGLLWAVILLSHQFSGVVATLGAMAVLLGTRPWPNRVVWMRCGTGLALGLTVVALWPYYSFFSLFGFQGLEEIHRPLYSDMWSRFGPASVGVLVLLHRWWRNKRDPLAIFCLLGTLTVLAGGLTDHWSWGRALPAAVIPAQLALALTLAEGVGRLARNAFLTIASAALLIGCWAQAGTLGYVFVGDALPQAVQEKTWPTRQGYDWMTPWVKPGDTVMATFAASTMIPAYGAYTVAPGFEDVFLPDEQERYTTVARFFSPDATRNEQLAALHRYHAKWLLRGVGDGGLPDNDPALRMVAVRPDRQVLYKVVG